MLAVLEYMDHEDINKLIKVYGIIARLLQVVSWLERLRQLLVSAAYNASMRLQAMLNPMIPSRLWLCQCVETFCFP